MNKPEKSAREIRLEFLLNAMYTGFKIMAEGLNKLIGKDHPDEIKLLLKQVEEELKK
jgi:hypothetical protein